MMPKRKTRLAALLLWLALLFLSGRPALRAQDGANLLQNPGFELPYLADGAATGWVRWHRESGADARDGECLNGYHFRPKWSAETVSSQFIHQGSASQHVGNNWDTWAGGVWQTVPVTNGARYRFTIFIHGRGSNEAVPAPSEAGLQMNARIGLDPNGSGLWTDADVVWSGTGNPHDTWQQFALEATATGDAMTVFTAADWGVPGVNQCRQFLDVWFDSAQLSEVAPPTPTPAPTNTPLPPTVPPSPTSPPPPTAIPAATATNTPPPAPTATATAPPPAGGAVCFNAFDDVNGNGQHEASEGYVAGVTFTIAAGDELIRQTLSSGTATPACLEGIAPGAYQVGQSVPARLEMTTAPNATIEVVAGQTIGLEFGSRLRTEAPAATASPEGSGDAPEPAPATVEAPEEEGGRDVSLLALSGLALIAVAIILLGIMIFLLLRR